MLITDRGQTIRTPVDQIRETGRNAQGVKLMTLSEGERIVAVERLAEASDEVGGGSMTPPAGDEGTPPSTSDLN
jgi:DNA gyrase subunit A